MSPLRPRPPARQKSCGAKSRSRPRRSQVPSRALVGESLKCLKDYAVIGVDALVGHGFVLFQCWRGTGSARCLTPHHNRNFEVGEYLHRLAAQYQRGYPSAPVRSHADSVATSVVRGFDDCGVRMIVKYVYPFEAQARPSASLRPLLMTLGSQRLNATTQVRAAL